MSKLTHIDADGHARMVDVGDKAVSRRTATATGHIRMSDAALSAIRAGDVAKGDVLGTARLAGIMAAKRTAELIPLCHPLALDKVDVQFSFTDAGIDVLGTASLSAKTGVEMEALTAVSVALLTIYDMAKAIDKAMVIEGVRLASKSGGSSGDWVKPG